MSLSKNQLISNIDTINETISQSKQPTRDVTVVAVTKYVDTKVMKELYDLNIRQFGENRSDALIEKQKTFGELTKEIEWHFIGRLQRRPVKDIINDIDYLHSLDRMSLAKEVNKRADHPIKCFLQVNISGEEQKAGFAPDDVIDVIKELEVYDNITIVGLMTMAPNDATESDAREIFSELRDLQQAVENMELAYAPCHELSMGMSQDYKIAVEEGATYVRIGSAIYAE